MNATDKNDHQHYRPQYLAGQIDAIIIAIAKMARIAKSRERWTMNWLSLHTSSKKN